MKRLIGMLAVVLLLVPGMHAAGISAAGASCQNVLLPSPVIPIQLAPHNPPIVLPSSGGSFSYSITLMNNSQLDRGFDVWTILTLPDGSTTDPRYGPVHFTLPGCWSSQSGDRPDYISPDMPGGVYTYTAYAGRYPGSKYSSASFTFEKQVATPGWYPQNSGTTDVLSGLDFVDAQTGWVVGQNTVLHTTNGGDTWFEQATPTYYAYNAVDFVNSQVGWVVGGFGTIIHTTDGGQSWTLQDSGYSTGAYTWSDLQFVDANTGWVVGGFSDAFGQSGRIILHTTDGGSNWETQLYEGYSAVLSAVSFIDDQNGWTVSTSNNLLHTGDGGLNWMDADPGQGNFFRDVDFVDSLHGWIADSYSGQVLRTVDGGNSWQAFDIQQPIYIEALHFNDVNIGWLAGGDNYTGSILNTTDGGQTWQVQYTGDLILFGIDFVDAFQGWAVGWNGIILHTDTGGG